MSNVVEILVATAVIEVVETGERIAVQESTAAIVEVAEQGPPGANAVGYVHTQSSPATVWTVNHNLGVRGSVEIRSVGGEVLIAQVLHVSSNQLLVTFADPTAGTARVI